MSKALVASINQIATEKDLDREVIYQAIEAALVSAYKRNYGAVANIAAKVDRLSGDMSVLSECEVVDDVLTERTEITLDQARKIKSDAQLGDVILVEKRMNEFGRIAAQTAKQVILQRIREAERDTVFENFAHKVNEVLTAQVRSIDAQTGVITLVLEDKHEVLLMREEQIGSEKLRRGDFVKVYVVDVHRSTRGPVIKLSRTHRNLLRRLMEMEIPEVREGIVEIKSIAREPGQRSKAAVVATRPNVDPVGSCVGPRGLRIQNIVNELAGEKIDVVEWSSDPASYISNALSPAKISFVLPDEKSSIKTAVVVVPDKQLSLAIGKEGQNARLAAKLTGWRIDIKSESEAAAEGLDAQMAERSRRSKAGDLLSFAEQLLKSEPTDNSEERLLQAALALQSSTSSSDIGESLDFDEADDKTGRRGKKTRPRTASAADTLGDALLEDTGVLSEISTSDLDAAFQRGLQAMQSFDEEPAPPSETAFGDALKALGMELEMPTFSEPLPEETPTKPAPTPAPASAPTPTPSRASEAELPQVITAAMLRERMAQRKERSLQEIEVPAELLEGYDLATEEEAEADQRDQNLAAKKTKKVVPAKPVAKAKKKRPRAYIDDESEETY
ncbi:MAG: transcription termination factor NusA [Caldilineaceae bacterium]